MQFGAKCRLGAGRVKFPVDRGWRINQQLHRDLILLRPGRATSLLPSPMSADAEFETLAGCDLNAFCHALYHRQPKWVTGSISYYDTRFLFKTALESGCRVAVEIGTAAGFSTGVLCRALEMAGRLGRIPPDFQVVSYDIARNFYADLTKRVGDAAREELSAELLEHVVFKNPATALDVRKDYAESGVDLLFIDANHQHPWPTLDLLATLDVLRPGATVLFHDINLPVLYPEFADWGVHHLVNDPCMEMQLPLDTDNPDLPNICSIRIPAEKEPLRAALVKLLAAHPWHATIEDSFLAKLGMVRPDAPAVK